MTREQPIESAPTQRPDWIRRPWCVATAVGLLILSFISNLVFLYNHCPFDLSEDESHYWQWSQRLAWGYYSKGPGIAAIIHAAVAVGRWFGQAHATMPVIRTPAVIFSLVSGLTSMFFVRRIFRDDRAGLMVIILSAGMPVFAVGSLIMTIDSPMYCAWALATLCLWLAVEPRPGPANRVVPTSAGKARWWWLYAAGVFTGLGILCKPVLLFLPPSLAIAAGFNRWLRSRLATWNSLGALLVALLMQIPTLLWNAAHHWVMFRTIGGEGGLGGTIHLWSRIRQLPGHVLLYIGSQAGICAGILFVLLVLAIVDGILHCRRNTDPVQAAPWCFLLAMTLPIFAFYFLVSLWNKVQPNWPAAGYFSGMALLAGIATQRWNEPARNRWYRRWVVAAVAVGFVLTVFAENVQRLYPLLGRLEINSRHISPKKWDPAFRLHDLKLRGRAIQKVRLSMWSGRGPLPLVIARRWDTASSLAFYLPGRPFVFCIQSMVGGPVNQFDLWPGIDQINPKTGKLRYAGRAAVLTGNFPPAAFAKIIVPAFARISPLEIVPLYYDGIYIEHLNVWKCYGFKGFPRGKFRRSY